MHKYRDFFFVVTIAMPTCWMSTNAFTAAAKQCKGMLTEDYGSSKCAGIGEIGAWQDQILYCCCLFVPFANMYKKDKLAHKPTDTQYAL